MNLVLLASFVDSTGQRVWYFDIQTGIVVDGEVVRSEQKIPPHEPSMRNMELNNLPKVIVVPTNLESCSLDVGTQCTIGHKTDSRPSYVVKYR